MPNIVVMINNYEAFLETYEESNEQLVRLTREATRYGIYFILTATNESSIRLPIKQITYVLQQNNDVDYMGILRNTKGKIPAKIKGRGLFKKDKIYEFQTASIKEEMTNNMEIIVGMNKENLNIEKYNLVKNPVQLISSYDFENIDEYIDALINQFTYKQTNFLMFNTTEHQFSNANLNNRYITKNFEETFRQITNYINNVYTLYETNNFNEEIPKKQQKMVCIIYGIYNFINKLSKELQENLIEIIKKISN